MSAVTQNEFTGNNSTTQYNFTFPYLKTSDIKVSLDGVETSNFTFANATTIQLNNGATPPVATAPASGVKIRILRETTVDNLTATFYAGSAIKSEDLNDNFTQNLYVTQEVNQRYVPTSGGTFTGNLDLGGNKVINIGNPVNAGDAVNKTTLDSSIDTAIDNDILAGIDISKTASGGQVTINHDVAGANTTINNSNGNVIQDLTISAQGHVTSAGSVDLDGRYYTETELDAGALDSLYFRQDSSETITSGVPWSAGDTHVATTAAIDARIIDLVDEVGGFDIVANEQSFPDTNPGGTTGQAAVLSIKEATTDLTPTGTTVTITNGNVSNNANITITGLPSSLVKIPQGFGFLVESTSTLHTYTFHRLVPKALEVSTVANNIGNVNNVGNNISDVQTANTNIGEISQVSTNINYVTPVGQNIAAVTSAANNIANIHSFNNNYQIRNSAPTTDGGGNALSVGNLYFDTTANELRVYNGSAWQGGVTATGNLYSDASVDTHLNKTNSITSGYVLSWNGADYAWVDNAGYTDSDVNTHLNQSTATSNQVMSWNGNDFAWVDQSSGLVGSSNEKLFVEAENAMDNDFTTTAGNNYVSASPLTINATLTVVSGSTMSFV